MCSKYFLANKKGSCYRQTKVPLYFDQSAWKLKIQLSLFSGARYNKFPAAHDWISTNGFRNVHMKLLLLGLLAEPRYERLRQEEF